MKDFTAKFENSLSHMQFALFHRPVFIDTKIEVCPTGGFCQVKENIEEKKYYHANHLRVPSVGLRYAVYDDPFNGHYRVASYIVCTNRDCFNAINRKDADWISNFLERVGPARITVDEVFSPETDDLFGF